MQLGYKSIAARDTDLANRIAPFLTEISAQSPENRRYQKCLNEIFYLLLLYVGNRQDYDDDALQITSLALCKKIKKLAKSGISIEPLHLINWFKKYLKWEVFKNKVRPLPLPLLEPEKLPAPQDSKTILEYVMDWIDEDADGLLRKTKMKKYDRITAQIVLKHRIINTSWKELSNQLNAPVSSLSSFFTRQCLPLLRKFAQSEFYLDNSDSSSYPLRE
jgi:hypothetical protein